MRKSIGIFIVFGMIVVGCAKAQTFSVDGEWELHESGIRGVFIFDNGNVEYRIINQVIERSMFLGEYFVNGNNITIIWTTIHGSQLSFLDHDLFNHIYSENYPENEHEFRWHSINELIEIKSTFTEDNYNYLDFPPIIFSVSGNMLISEDFFTLTRR